ncbi:S8 family serine peptidase [Ekhidna sp.]|uniref:S8 family serine peptidase n=1 Tax=Ekhidna sp. TaxID=2608089 RepID=UPI003B50399F
MSFSQTRLLKEAQFEDHSIDTEWIYVKLKPSVTDFPFSDHKILGRTNSDSPEIIKLRVPRGKDPVTFCNELRLTGDYQYADPIISYQLLANPSDPLLGNQYYLDNIKAFEAWGITTGDDDITIGIIDSGLDLDHEDIIANLWLNENDTIDGIDNDNNGYIDDYFGYDFADEDSDPTIQNGNHGMIVGGLAGARANNDKGIAGVGYNTKIAALKGFRSSNNTSNGLYEAIIYAADNGIDVVNLSWGRMGEPLESEQDIINYAVLEKNIIVVAAAGNEGGQETEENKWYPASYENVLSVAATDASDSKWSGSTFNYSVDLVAPGVDMFSTVASNGYADGGPGTSYASPLVAAGSALVKDQYPELSAIQIMERIRATTDDIYDIGINGSFEGKLGKGRLNILQAVTESNVKSVRARNTNFSSTWGDLIFFGDTVQITSQVINYLGASNNPQITVSSPENDFTITDTPEPIGFLSTMDTASLSFEIVLDQNISPDSKVNIRLDYSEGTYNDFQFLELVTEPDYTDFGNDKVSMTISGNGNLGYNEYEPNQGSGLQYLSDTLMNYVGLMLATDGDHVSDNIISNYIIKSREEDFSVDENHKWRHHPGADHFSYSEFSDPSQPIKVEQSNLTWNGADYLVTRYRIINHTDTAINNLSIGLFADWDLIDASTNYAAFDTIKNYAYARNLNQDLFAGVQVLGNGLTEFSALDMDNLNGNSADINDVLTDSIKYHYLINQQLATAGSEGSGNHVATLSGITISQIDSANFEYVDVIYAIAESKELLDSVIALASSQLNDFLTKPQVLERFFTCDGSYTIDPSNGAYFHFYSDPLASTKIATDSVLVISNLQNDTIFYARNIDGNYPSEVFEIRLSIFTDFADFELSTDTLYLDNPTTNVVSFNDLSQGAISWNWDFGQGTSATIQNPALSFSEPGNYNIQLTVENEEGCNDSITKTLVVANRPAPPTIDDRIVCEGSDVTITDPTAEKVHVYLTEDQTTPTLSGASVQMQNITSDTIFYVSGTYNSFESDKTPLLIDVLEVAGSINVMPDTSSAEFRMLLISENIADGSNIQWTVNGNDLGTDESVNVLAEGTISVNLSITSSDNCTKILSKQVSVSSSLTPIQGDLFSCDGDSVLIQPSNGSYFGFYEDPELTQPIKKGTRLKTNAYEKVYVVGLDDGLPSIPIEVNITNQIPEVEINYIANPVGPKQAVSFMIETSFTLASSKWFVDGVLTEVSAQPTLFLDNQPYLIVVNVTTTEGCNASDTLNLDLTPPLLIADDNQLLIYPNPSTGIVNFTASEISLVEVIQMDGKIVSRLQISNAKIDISSLEKGMYLIKVYYDGKSTIHQLLLR